MTVLKPRSRKVSVRLSEEEYVALRRLCSLTSARSVSDVTREAVRAVVKDVNRDDQLGRHLDEFRAGMKSLERKVEQLEAKIATFEGENAQ
jgi:Arc/MetJ-type ribon-helix-helix transcriptional regulator